MLIISLIISICALVILLSKKCYILSMTQWISIKKHKFELIVMCIPIVNLCIILVVVYIILKSLFKKYSGD